MRVDLEDIEPLDLVFAGADIRESPVPDNFAAAEDDIVCVDIRLWSIIEDFGDELGLGCGIQVAQLSYTSVCV